MENADKKTSNCTVFIFKKSNDYLRGNNKRKFWRMVGYC